MATTIRLARGGSKKRPYYRLVVADSRSPRDGKFIEKLGTYDPLVAKDDPKRLVLNEERIKYWLGVGATPSERVATFLIAAKLFKRSKNDQKVLDARTKKSQEEVKAKKAAEEAKRKEEEAAKKAEEAAAKAAAAEVAKAAEAAAPAEGEQAAG